jgi:hypothetical protein
VGSEASRTPAAASRVTGLGPGTRDVGDQGLAVTKFAEGHLGKEPIAGALGCFLVPLWTPENREVGRMAAWKVDRKTGPLGLHGSSVGQAWG